MSNERHPTEDEKLCGAVYRYIARNPDCSVDELARQLLSAPSDVRRVLKALIDGGNVVGNGRHRLGQPLAEVSGIASLLNAAKEGGK